MSPTPLQADGLSVPFLVDPEHEDLADHTNGPIRSTYSSEDF